MTKKKKFSHDVFISYRWISPDQEWVLEQLAPALKRAGLQVWLICLPKGGEPWVAGWTEELHPAGRWVVNAAQLWKEGQSRLLDIVAVIASDDPTKVSPKDLRSWTYQTRRPLRIWFCRLRFRRKGRDRAYWRSTKPGESERGLDASTMGLELHCIEW